MIKRFGIGLLGTAVIALVAVGVATSLQWIFAQVHLRFETAVVLALGLLSILLFSFGLGTLIETSQGYRALVRRFRR